jgi:hypothetical protein
MTRNKENEMSLQRVAHERIESGELPCDTSARMWGSHGSGAPCALCGRPIGPDEIEYEVETRVKGKADTLQFHRLCHSIWHSACEGELAR